MPQIQYPEVLRHVLKFEVPEMGWHVSKVEIEEAWDQDITGVEEMTEKEEQYSVDLKEYNKFTPASAQRVDERRSRSSTVLT